MWFTDRIFALVWDISDWFLEAYYIVREWPWPFGFLGGPLLYISNLTWDLLTPIADFGVWVSDTINTLRNLLTFDNIWSYFKSWFEWAEWAWVWVDDAWTNVWQIADAWWGTVQETVKTWIDIAVQGFNELRVALFNFWATTWPDLIGRFDTLATAWDNFWTVTMPTLVNVAWIITWWNARLQDINDLIDTAFTLRDSLWEGWQELRSDVTEFFADPLEWLWGRFTNWFLGPEV